MKYKIRLPHIYSGLSRQFLSNLLITLFSSLIEKIFRFFFGLAYFIVSFIIMFLLRFDQLFPNSRLKYYID